MTQATACTQPCCRQTDDVRDLLATIAGLYAKLGYSGSMEIRKVNPRQPPKVFLLKRQEQVIVVSQSS